MQTKTITEGAMLAGVTVLLAVLGSVFSSVSLVLPVPLAIMVYRNGLRPGIIVSVTSALLSALILRSVLVSFDIIAIGLVGIALGITLREKFNITQIVGLVTGSAIASMILRAVSLSILFGTNIINVYTEVFDQTSEQWIKILESTGFTPEFIAEYNESLIVLINVVKKLIPIGLVITAFAQAIIALIITRLILRRLGDEVPGLPPFRTWKWPWYFIWLFFLSVLLNTISGFLSLEILSVIGLNLISAFLVLFFIQGLAIVWFYFDKNAVPTFYRVLFIFLLFFPSTIGVFILAIFGVLDLWFDFRNRNNDPKKEELK